MKNSMTNFEKTRQSKDDATQCNNRTQDTGYWTLDTGYWTLDTGHHRTMEVRLLAILCSMCLKSVGSPIDILFRWPIL